MPHNFQVGDKVRSYDFPFRKDCYVEGVITKIEGAMADIDVSADVTENRPTAGARIKVRTYLAPSMFTGEMLVEKIGS